MNAIILCGGLSTRLGEITASIPKVLLPLGPQTVLDWQLDALATAGVTEVVLAAGHLSDVLVHAVGDVRRGIRVRYAIEPSRLGTGGAIRFALQYVAQPTEPTIILNGDIMTSTPMREMVQAFRPESDGVILGAYVPDAAAYGTLDVGEGNVLKRFKEKEGLRVPGFINGGWYIFSPKMTKYFPEAEVFSVEYDVFPRVQQMDVFPSSDVWIDIGQPERLAWAREHWQEFLP